MTREFSQALQFHQQGKYHEAEVYYRRVLDNEPHHATCLHHLGLVLHMQGASEPALDYIERALKLDANNAQLHFNYAVVLQALNRLIEAEHAYLAAIKLMPTLASAHNNLGRLYFQQKIPGKARFHLEQAFQHAPESIDVRLNYSALLREQQAFEQAHAILSEALTGHRDDMEIFNALATVEIARTDYMAAQSWLERALSCEPDYVNALANAGLVHMMQQNWEEARAHLEKAVSINPNSLEAQNNFAELLRQTGEYDAALEHYAQALQIAPESAEVHNNRGLLLLLLDQYELGWREHEWRLKLPHTFNMGLRTRGDIPVWQGQPLAGKTLLVCSEQGLGDALQFCRYILLLADQGARVIIDCPKSLHALLQRSLPLQACYDHQGSDLATLSADYQISLMSLPLHFKTTPETIPCPSAYLSCDHDKHAKWSERLSVYRGKKVGVVWAGNPLHRNDHQRSVPFTLLKSLIERSDIHFFSLQLNGSEVLGTHDWANDVVDLGKEIVDWDDTAAILACLDELVTVDTAVAHLAGALGVRTSLLVSYVPDWRWRLDCKTSVWYPSIKLFRQKQLGDWHSVVPDLIEHLDCRGKEEAFPSTLLAQAIQSHQAGNLSQAECLYRQILTENPQHVRALNYLGMIAFQSNKLNDAYQLCRAANKIAPNDPEVLNNLGLLMQRKGQDTEAEAYFKRALAVDSGMNQAHVNLCGLLLQQGRIEDALDCVDRGLTLCSSAELYNNQGLLYREKGEWRAALSAFDQAIRMQPHYVDAHWNRSHILLLQEKYTIGWDEYQWGKYLPVRRHLDCGLPEWQGEVLHDKTLIVIGEQGVGDQIMFATCIPDVLKEAKQCVLLCETRLVPVFQRAFPKVKVLSEASVKTSACAIQADYQIAIASLPRILRRSKSHFAHSNAFLRADASKTDVWMSRLSALNPWPKVGISWFGGATEMEQRHRTVDLKYWSALWSLQKVQYVNLQYGSQRQRLFERDDIDRSRVIDFNDLDLKNELDHALALIQALDLVITVDNSTAHFAAAMGKPVWLLTPSTPDWRWGLKAERSVWYPSVVLFRCGKEENWSEVLARVASRLDQLLLNATQSPYAFDDNPSSSSAF